MDRCAAKTRSGQPCHAYPVAGSRFCFTHDPDLAAARAQARHIGGTNSRPPPDPALFSNADLKTPAGLRRFAEELIRLTREDKISTHRSRVLGYLMLAQRRLIEFDELDERLSALEYVLMHKKEPDAHT